MPLESAVERHVVRYAKRHGVESIKLNVWGTRGWMDRLFLFPRAPVFVEFKRDKNHGLTELQKKRVTQLLALRYAVHVIWDKIDGERLIDHYLEMQKEHAAAKLYYDEVVGKAIESAVLKELKNAPHPIPRANYETIKKEDK